MECVSKAVDDVMDDLITRFVGVKSAQYADAFARCKEAFENDDNEEKERANRILTKIDGFFDTRFFYLYCHQHGFDIDVDEYKHRLSKIGGPARRTLPYESKRELEKKYFSDDPEGLEEFLAIFDPIDTEDEEWNEFTAGNEESIDEIAVDAVGPTTGPIMEAPKATKPEVPEPAAVEPMTSEPAVSESVVPEPKKARRKSRRTEKVYRGQLAFDLFGNGETLAMDDDDAEGVFA